MRGQRVGTSRRWKCDESPIACSGEITLYNFGVNMSRVTRYITGEPMVVAWRVLLCTLTNVSYLIYFYIKTNIINAKIITVFVFLHNGSRVPKWPRHTTQT